MDGQEFDLSATLVSSLLARSDSGGGSRIDDATIDFSVPPGDPGIPEPPTEGPSLLLSCYPACYSLPAAGSGSAAQPGAAALPCLSEMPVTSASTAITKEEAWYGDGELQLRRGYGGLGILRVLIIAKNNVSNNTFVCGIFQPNSYYLITIFN